MKTSKFLTVNQADAVKGFIVAIITAGLTVLMTMLDGGVIPTDGEWKKIGIAALSAGIAYLIKNVLTNSNDKFVKGEEGQK
jgi:hypothetical protein